MNIGVIFPKGKVQLEQELCGVAQVYLRMHTHRSGELHTREYRLPPFHLYTSLTAPPTHPLSQEGWGQATAVPHLQLAQHRLHLSIS